MKRKSCASCRLRWLCRCALSRFCFARREARWNQIHAYLPCQHCTASESRSQGVRVRPLRRQVHDGCDIIASGLPCLHLSALPLIVRGATAAFSLDPGRQFVCHTAVSQLMYREEETGLARDGTGPAQVGGGLGNARARAVSLMQAARCGKASLTTAPCLAGHSVRYAVIQIHRDCTIDHHCHIVLPTAIFHVGKGQRREVKMKKHGSGQNRLFLSCSLCMGMH